jgi:hypothetical protein
MSRSKTYSVTMITRGTYSGEVEATSQADAIRRTYDLWCNASPHPFEKDDNELMSVDAEEVRS